MRKRGVIILTVAFLALLGGLVAWAWTDRPLDPQYGGKPLSQWIGRSTILIAGGVMLEDERLPASLDSNAVPYLTYVLKQRDGSVRKAYQKLWPRFPQWLRMHLSDPKHSMVTKLNACGLLGYMGTDSRPAVPGLIHLLRDDEDLPIRAAAAKALGQIANHDDQPVVEALIAAAVDKDANVKESAIAALMRIAPEAAAKAGVTSSPLRAR